MPETHGEDLRHKYTVQMAYRVQACIAVYPRFDSEIASEAC